LEEALQLEPNDRAKIAEELLASLEQQNEDVYATWAAEIERRAADAKANPELEQDWREALADIRRDVLSR
jgi:putative addiction module component (TIGR02574 family)